VLGRARPYSRQSHSTGGFDGLQRRALNLGSDDSAGAKEKRPRLVLRLHTAELLIQPDQALLKCLVFFQKRFHIR
jgi:hypothetical protein